MGGVSPAGGGRDGWGVIVCFRETYTVGGTAVVGGSSLGGIIEHRTAKMSTSCFQQRAFNRCVTTRTSKEYSSIYHHHICVLQYAVYDIAGKCSYELCFLVKMCGVNINTRGI